MKSYAQQAVGMDPCKYPSLIDDAFSRSVLSTQALSGTGDKVVPIQDGAAGPPVFFGFTSFTIPKAVNEAGEVKLAITYNPTAKQFEVTATAGVIWTATAVYQRGVKD